MRWVEFAQSEERRSAELTRDAAKSILTALGIVFPFYGASLGVLVTKGVAVPGIFLVPLLLWSFAVLSTLVALLPKHWRAPADDPVAIRSEFRRVSDERSIAVWGAAILIFAGFILATIGWASLVL